LAAERATDKQIKKMENAFRQTEGLREVTALHFSFHRFLVESSQNPLLSQMVDVVIRLLSQSKRLSSVIQEFEKEKLGDLTRKIRDGHKKILKAIKSHNMEAAKRAMREHLRHLESLALQETGERAAENV